eukprot:TRINITY_DN21327_c0_g1_i2.p1 TRINITY_DN21327_c0_g1~~TRINITY_DN21327_c0_g1_i2.p1  ORF type:complete len:462 (-),score=96.55 TRINITY_DN21327_c0_g1_i2:750-2018(-)
MSPPGVAAASAAGDLIAPLMGSCLRGGSCGSSGASYAGLHGSLLSLSAPALPSRGSRSSFIDCEGDVPPKKLTVPAPPCLEGDGCKGEQDMKQVRAFSKVIDDSLEESLKKTTKFRKIFERRVNDYKYAEMEEDKMTDFMHTYGPEGPMLPGGSYLFAMRRWLKALHALKRACFKGDGGCSTLVTYLQGHPDDDKTPGGGHGNVGSKVWNEFRLACLVGRTRSPVPNDSPIWCSLRTGLCEQVSARDWWKEIHERLHPGMHAAPWVDDREVYDELKEACAWTSRTGIKNADLLEYQHDITIKSMKDKEEFCGPKWIEGYCEDQAKMKFGECHLAGNKLCKRGLVSPGSDLNEQAGWHEEFPEPPLGSGVSELLCVVAATLPALRRDPRPRRRPQRSAAPSSSSAACGRRTSAAATASGGGRR